MPSYHDVVVIVDGREYRISQSYAFELACTRVAGWRLWYNTPGGESTLIGGEYDSDEFIIKVQDWVVCANESSGEFLKRGLVGECCVEEIMSILEQLYAIELLEYHNKNWLSGSDCGRSVEKQELLCYVMGLIAAREGWDKR